MTPIFDPKKPITQQVTSKLTIGDIKRDLRKLPFYHPFISTSNSPPNPNMYLHYYIGEWVLIGGQISVLLLLETPIVYEVRTRHKPLILKLYQSNSFKTITNKSMVLALTGS